MFCMMTYHSRIRRLYTINCGQQHKITHTVIHDLLSYRLCLGMPVAGSGGQKDVARLDFILDDLAKLFL